jgi:outer membrane protein assembly factor BamB
MRRKEGAFIAAQAIIVGTVLILVSLPLGALPNQEASQQTSTTSSTSLYSSQEGAETLSLESCITTTQSPTLPLAITDPSVEAGVGSAFHDHIQLVASRNVPALLEEYQQNATVTWTGDSAGFGGSYNGTTSIEFNFKTTLGDWFAPTFAVRTENQSIIATGDTSAQVDSEFVFNGTSNIMGKYGGSILSKDYYVYQDAAGWLISHEIWNFTGFDVQYPVISGGPGPGPSPMLKVDAASFSDDGNYLAAGSADVGQKNGSVYLLSLQHGGELWDKSTNNSAISSVAVSDNGTYVAAGGYWSGMFYGDGTVFLFNKEGNLLWNYTTGMEPVWQVGVLPNGSGILAGDNTGLLYFDTAGHVLWNFTFPYQGSSTRFAVSANGEYIAAAVQNMLLPGQANFRWGVYYLNWQGRVLWNYTGDYSGVNYIQMSSDGKEVTVGTLVNGDNGSVYYFDGQTGKILWKEQAYTAVQPLYMSSDGSLVASGGNYGTLLFNSNGHVVWNDTTATPLGFTNDDQLLFLPGQPCPNLSLVDRSGTVLGSLEVRQLTAEALAPDSSEWAAFAGTIAGDGQCGSVDIFNGTSSLSSIPLC